MSTERLTEELGRQINRRKFLKKLGGSAVAALLALVGLPQIAFAYTYKCCNLCFSPTNACSGGCPDSQNVGEWCWTCHYYPESRDYRCCECKNAGAPCDSSCTGVYRSFAYALGSGPQPG